MQLVLMQLLLHFAAYSWVLFGFETRVQLTARWYSRGVSVVLVQRGGDPLILSRSAFAAGGAGGDWCSLARFVCLFKANV